MLSRSPNPKNLNLNEVDPLCIAPENGLWSVMLIIPMCGCFIPIFDRSIRSVRRYNAIASKSIHRGKITEVVASNVE